MAVGLNVCSSQSLTALRTWLQFGSLEHVPCALLHVTQPSPQKAGWICCDYHLRLPARPVRDAFEEYFFERFRGSKFFAFSNFGSCSPRGHATPHHACLPPRRSPSARLPSLTPSCVNGRNCRAEPGAGEAAEGCDQLPASDTRKWGVGQRSHCTDGRARRFVSGPVGQGHCAQG